METKKWTTDMPKTPGYYLVKRAGIPPLDAWVGRFVIVLRCFDPDNNRMVPRERWENGCEWQGPLAIPEDILAQVLKDNDKWICAECKEKLPLMGTCSCRERQDMAHDELTRGGM